MFLGLLASVPSTNGNGNGGMMAYSPGDQQAGTTTNSHCESIHKYTCEDASEELL